MAAALGALVGLGARLAGQDLAQKRQAENLMLQFAMSQPEAFLHNDKAMGLLPKSFQPMVQAIGAYKQQEAQNFAGFGEPEQGQQGPTPNAQMLAGASPQTSQPTAMAGPVSQGQSQPAADEYGSQISALQAKIDRGQNQLKAITDPNYEAKAEKLLNSWQSQLEHLMTLRGQDLGRQQQWAETQQRLQDARQNHADMVAIHRETMASAEAARGVTEELAKARTDDARQAALDRGQKVVSDLDTKIATGLQAGSIDETTAKTLLANRNKMAKQFGLPEIAVGEVSTWGGLSSKPTLVPTTTRANLPSGVPSGSVHGVSKSKGPGWMTPDGKFIPDAGK